MNKGVAKELRRLSGFDCKAERTYQRNPKTGVIYSNVQRQAYQKMKKQYNQFYKLNGDI